MRIDQTTYLDQVSRIEIDRVKPKYGGQVIRMRIKGEGDGSSSVDFVLWGSWNIETVEPMPIELVIRDVDETVQPEPKPAEAEPDV